MYFKQLSEKLKQYFLMLINGEKSIVDIKHCGNCFTQRHIIVSYLCTLYTNFYETYMATETNGNHVMHY